MAATGSNWPQQAGERPRGWSFGCFSNSGADPNTVSFDSLSPLLAATYIGDVEAVVHLPVSELTPASAARSQGHEELALFIEAAGEVHPTAEGN